MARNDDTTRSARMSENERILLAGINDGKIVHGRDGWMFLANDVNDVMAQHRGELRLDAQALERFRELIERRIVALRELGADYLFLIAPDTHSVYPEKLPEGFVPARERTVHLLIRHLEQAGLGEKVIYPLEEMLARKGDFDVCSPLDTHWSELGAFIAYERLLEEVERSVPVRRVSPEDIVAAPREFSGDLALKLGRRRITQIGVHIVPLARLVHDNLVNNAGATIVTECKRAPDVTCVLFGDSYSVSLIRYLAETFRRLVFVHSPQIDFDLVHEVRPQIVISEMAERFLIEVPDDSHRPGPRELAAQRLREGVLRPPLPYWDWDLPDMYEAPTVVPLEAVERMRALLLERGRDVDAALICAIAYAGLLPAEALALCWDDIGEGELRVVSRTTRSIPLFQPLADDLERLRPPEADGRVLTNERGWTRKEWKRWVEETYRPLTREAGTESKIPFDLRHTFSGLLLAEDRPWSEIARLTGMEKEMAVWLYRPMAADFAGGDIVPAEERIRRARAATA